MLAKLFDIKLLDQHCTPRPLCLLDQFWVEGTGDQILPLQGHQLLLDGLADREQVSVHAQYLKQLQQAAAANSQAISQCSFTNNMLVFKVHKSLDTTPWFGSRWGYRVDSEASLYGTSGCDISLYCRQCFWRQNYAFT